MTRKPRATFARGRLYTIVILLSLFWLGLEANLLRLQVAEHSYFKGISDRQVFKRVELQASRGEIFDRNGHKLATNTIHYDLAADPKMVENKKIIAQVCSRQFGKSRSHYLKLLSKDTRFVYLERSVPESRMGAILKLTDAGLIKEKRFRRTYPFESNAGQLIGYTDTDNRGLSGIELDFENLLHGESGEAVLMYDGPRRIYYSADFPIKKPLRGSNLYLTLDKNIQTVVERELERGVRRAGARSGMAVVMDPYSGALLAMANYPRFNPNRYKEYRSEWIHKNRTITDIFEPGSTFKVFSAAALLQENVKKLDDIVFCENGRYRIYNHSFHDSNREGYAWLTFAKVIENSSNIGMIKLSADLHPNTLFRYISSFGFGSNTEIGLDGEANGILARPETWSGLSKASISIGHEVGVTALQLAAGYCALVNGGVLYKPFLVHQKESAEGKINTLREPEVARRVISTEVSDLLKIVLRNTVQRGTGSKADVPGIEEGGKTGTAQKVDTRTGSYYQNKFIASFIGFAPYDDPKFVCAIFLDEPEGYNYYGGQIAAPVFRKVIENIINLPDAENDSFEENMKLVMTDNSIPDIHGMDLQSAEKILIERDKDYRIAGVGGFVKRVNVEDDVYVLTTAAPEVEMETMPGLVGLSVREALRMIDFSRFRVLIKGDGIVIKQSVAPGSKVKAGSTLYLTCK